jgi:pimeloyl-ACP methyl ester carboxylesterase/fibronectin type 3 domain-containing protein
MRRTMLMIPVATAIAVLVLVLYTVGAEPLQDPGQPGPYTTSSITITTTNPSTGSILVTDLYLPGSGGGVDPSGAPYPTMVFAHGFMASPSGYVGYGEHLGSWGYIVAIPDFPDEAHETRASDIQHLFSYLEAENSNEASLFFQKIDADRFGLAGHSLGGLSTMMVASRDARINMAGVPLDPAGSELNPWDYGAELANITAPLVVIGAPAQLCNNQAEYNDMYPYIGATHRAKFIISDGSHCDFLNTDDTRQTALCGILCGAYSPERSAIAERYTTAWFNYYLRLNTDYYTYLYGAEADADIQAGIISRTVDTAPRDVAAAGGFRAVELSWTLYEHPIITGYNIYRSLESGYYSGTPYSQVGRLSSYTDTDVVPGQEYYYVVRSRDGGGNEHEASDEVSATLKDAPMLLHPPNGTVTTTQAITFEWQADAGASAEGYNVQVDTEVITTTGMTSPTVLSVGVHTWTVRAYDRTGYSEWASPAWRVEVTATLSAPDVPLLIAPPDGTITTSQAITLAWQAGDGATPEGYNVQVDGGAITTTETTSPTMLATGLHTWTVRAHNAAGYSGWASPAWRVEVTETLPTPNAPTLLAPPDGTITTSQAITLGWQAGGGGAPAGYNVQVDGETISTTGTTSPTILTIGASLKKHEILLCYRCPNQKHKGESRDYRTFYHRTVLPYR